MMRPSHDVLREAADRIGVKALAAHLNLSQALVYKWCQEHDRADPDTSGARNPLDRVAEIVQATGDPEIANWICQCVGGFFTPNPKVESKDFSTDLLRGTQQLVKEFSDMLEEVSQSIADDGEIEAHEAARIRRHWESLKRVAEAFVVGGERGLFNSHGTDDA